MGGHSKGMLFGFSLLAALVMSFLIATSARAQVSGATMSGTVTDPSGAVIPKAQVSIKNTSTGVTRNATTDTSGLYNAPNLLPGPYSVTVSASGFSTEVRSGIVLTVGGQQVLNVALQVGKVTNLVQVTGAAPSVQLSSSTISNNVNSTTVRNLPLNGRSWTDLTLLTPGVATITTQPSFNVGSDRGNRGYGNQASISGVRPQFNNYRIDGISVNDYANGGPGSVTGGALGVDAIQEFSVMTTNYSAEYGRTAGGVINAITRSGTNQFHGCAYEFLRNDALDASNFFDNFANKAKPSFRRNQFGGCAGGPIQKDKTFIFGDYEGIRQAQAVPVLDSVPSAAARTGILSTGNVTVDPSVQKYLPFFPLPNAGLATNGDTGLFAFEQNQVVTENYFTTRVDHTITSKDSAFGTFTYDKTPFTSPDNYNNVLLLNQTFRETVGLEETHIFSPTLVNSLRFGYNRNSANDSQSASAINPLAADLSLGAVPGRAAAQIGVGGLNAFIGGVGGSPTYLYHWNDFQVYDDAFKTVGTHAIKFGGGVEREQLNMVALSNPNGVFSFGSLSKFLTNQPSKFNAGFPETLTARGFRQTILGAYVQDDWRYKPNLTLNLGLRYEMATVPTEVQGKLTNLRNFTDATPHLGSPLFSNPTYHDFEPRVGFAWDPFHNGKTSIRGGFGMFDVLPLPYLIAVRDALSGPFFKLGTVSNPGQGTFYAGAFPLLGLSSFRGDYMQPNMPRDYTMQWNYSMQQQLTPSVVAMVAYVGSRGVHLPFTADDGDIVFPTLTSAGYLWPNPIGSGTKLNTNWGEIRTWMPEANSFYDALEAQVTKRMSHGLQVQSSFTWGKSIDTNSASIAGDQFSNSIASLAWYDQSLDRSLSDFNVGRTLVINAVWEVPSPKSVTGPAHWLTNGWQLGGIFTAEDGIPFTPTFGTNGDPLGLNSGDPWDFPDVVAGSGCQSLTNPGNANNYIKTNCFTVPTAPSAAFYNANCDQSVGNAALLQCFNLRGNAGRNIVNSPGIADLDFSLFKNNYIPRISENFNAQFRVEVFNILNRANFANPVRPDNTDVFDASGALSSVAGLLTSTTTSAREIQFALKLIW